MAVTGVRMAVSRARTASCSTREWHRLCCNNIADGQTGRHARPDFYWVRDDRFVIVGELDGNEKYVNAQMTGGASVEQVVDAERERERLLLRNGVDRIVRFRVRETYDRAQFIRKLLEAGVPLCK